jgi:hypothetical protein
MSGLEIIFFGLIATIAVSSVVVRNLREFGTVGLVSVIAQPIHVTPEEHFSRVSPAVKSLPI